MRKRSPSNSPDSAPTPYFHSAWKGPIRVERSWTRERTDGGSSAPQASTTSSYGPPIPRFPRGRGRRTSASAVDRPGMSRIGVRRRNNVRQEEQNSWMDARNSTVIVRPIFDEFGRSTGRRFGNRIFVATIRPAAAYGLKPNLFAAIRSLRKGCRIITKSNLSVMRDVMKEQESTETAGSDRTRRSFMRRTGLVAAGIPAVLAMQGTSSAADRTTYTIRDGTPDETDVYVTDAGESGTTASSSAAFRGTNRPGTGQRAVSNRGR